MTIKNLDRAENEEFKTQFINALQSGDEKEFAEVMTSFASGIQKNILDQAKKDADQIYSDNQILSQRGAHILTSEEKKYYNAVIEGQSFVGVNDLVPATVINRVFDDLERNHPLLSLIEFQNVTGSTEWLVNNSGVNPAWWGKLCDDIKELLVNGFEIIKTDLFKLSAYLPVCKAMLDLGPEWLDRYVVAVLRESVAIASEEAIVNGSGKEQPIGMMRDLEGSVTLGVYPEKAAIPITSLSPATIGKEIMSPLSIVKKNEEGDVTHTRVVNQVLLIVNPVDYWGTVFPLTTFQGQTGDYVFEKLPITAKIVQSVSVPAGKMVAGVAQDYFMGVGSSQKIEYSDEVRFIEDERVYIIKQYANGRPKQNTSFLVFDISGVVVEEPVVPVP